MEATVHGLHYVCPVQKGARSVEMMRDFGCWAPVVDQGSSVVDLASPVVGWALPGVDEERVDLVEERWGWARYRVWLAEHPL